MNRQKINSRQDKQSKQRIRNQEKPQILFNCPINIWSKNDMSLSSLFTIKIGLIGLDWIDAILKG